MQVCGDCYNPTVKSAQELHHFQLVRGREGLNDVDHVDLDAFVSKGTQAPQRAVQGLRRFSSAGQLGCVLPTSALASCACGQAEPGYNSVPADGRGPEEATLMSLSQTELLALGDWQDKAPVRASMPLHYSNTRYQLSAKVHFVASAELRQLRGGYPRRLNEP